MIENEVMCQTSFGWLFKLYLSRLISSELYRPEWEVMSQTNHFYYLYHNLAGVLKLSFNFLSWIYLCQDNIELQCFSQLIRENAFKRFVLRNIKWWGDIFQKENPNKWKVMTNAFNRYWFSKNAFEIQLSFTLKFHK